MSAEKVLWVQDWEHETLDEVNERYKRYSGLLNKDNDEQRLHAFSYERKLMKVKASPDLYWMIRRELYYPEDEELSDAEANRQR